MLQRELLAEAESRSQGEAARDLERDYARAALHSLAQHAAAVDTSGWTDDEREVWYEAFFDEFVHYQPPSLPSRPPAKLPLLEETYLTYALSTLSALAGGLLWGVARGSFASSRARRTVLRSTVATAMGALFFEGCMLLRAEAVSRMSSPSSWPQPPPGLAPEPVLFSTLVRYALHQSLTLGTACALLQLLVQPHRAPFAFGGWVVGRGIYLSQELVEMSIQISDSPL